MDMHTLVAEPTYALEQLRHDVSGTLLLPGDSRYEQTRRGWNLSSDQRPALILVANCAHDVAAGVRYARAHGLGVAVQSTGHGMLHSAHDNLLIVTSRMTYVEIDPELRSAYVEAGVIWKQVLNAAADYELAPLLGSSPDVGVVGYTLGGGLSWLGRRHGFACNRVEAIELVTAEGEMRTVDAEDGEDLFWALRGGGGGYAIVTALRLRLVELADVYAGALLFPASLGAEAVRAYRDWAAGVGDEITSVVRFITPPDLPDVPEPLRGTPLLTIDGAVLAGREEGERAIAPLRELGEPIFDTFDQVPPVALSRIHMDPEQPVPGLGDGLTLRELSDEAIDAWAGAIGPGTETPLLLSELRQLGGALGRPAEGGGALSKIDAEFVMYSVGITPTPEAEEAVGGFLDALAQQMGPWAADGAYFNFSDRERPIEEILPGETCERLAEVKRRWDPEGRIVANHAVAA